MAVKHSSAEYLASSGQSPWHRFPSSLRSWMPHECASPPATDSSYSWLDWLSWFPTIAGDIGDGARFATNCKRSRRCMYLAIHLITIDICHSATGSMRHNFEDDRRKGSSRTKTFVFLSTMYRSLRHDRTTRSWHQKSCFWYIVHRIFWKFAT